MANKKQNLGKKYKVERVEMNIISFFSVKFQFLSIYYGNTMQALPINLTFMFLAIN